MCKVCFMSLFAICDTLVFPLTLVPEECSNGAIPLKQAKDLAELILVNALVEIINFEADTSPNPGIDFIIFTFLLRSLSEFNKVCILCSITDIDLLID